jgi:hypothetical protein
MDSYITTLSLWQRVDTMLLQQYLGNDVVAEERLLARALAILEEATDAVGTQLII